MTGVADRARRIVAGLATWISILLSLWLPVMLPPYLTNRVLAGGDTVELRLALHKPPAPNPLRVPYEYVFEVDGQEYRGTEFLSEDAVIWDPDTESASARVVYSRDDPSQHRMEPTMTIGASGGLVFFRGCWRSSCACPSAAGSQRVGNTSID